MKLHTVVSVDEKSEVIEREKNLFSLGFVLQIIVQSNLHFISFLLFPFLAAPP